MEFTSVGKFLVLIGVFLVIIGGLIWLLGACHCTWDAYPAIFTSAVSAGPSTSP